MTAPSDTPRLKIRVIYISGSSTVADDYWTDDGYSCDLRGNGKLLLRLVNGRNARNEKVRSVQGSSVDLVVAYEPDGTT